MNKQESQNQDALLQFQRRVLLLWLQSWHLKHQARKRNLTPSAQDAQGRPWASNGITSSPIRKSGIAQNNLQ